MKMIKTLLGTLFFVSIAAAIFFGVQYIHLNSKNSSLVNKMSEFDQTLASLEGQITDLESAQNSLLKRVAELAIENSELKKELRSKVLETETLTREIERLNEPPVSADASTPWERLQYSAELGKQKKWGEYWELLDSGLKERCSKENFIARLTAKDPAPLEFVFVEQEMGKTRATVWVYMNGKIIFQRFVLENGEWMIYIEGGSC